MILEEFYTCPYCFSEVSILIEPAEGAQEYIEDCENCCNPIQFRFAVEYNEFDEAEVTYLEADSIEQ